MDPAPLPRRRWLLVRTRGGQHPGYSEELESARGLAIALVLAWHFMDLQPSRGVFAQLGWPVPHLAGHTGVSLFFVLSGFLLGRPFVRALRAGTALPDVRRYFERRALRILPLYLVVVLVAALVTGEWGHALRALVFATGGADMHPFSEVWWSLAVEVQYYLLLPLVAWLGLRFGPRLPLLLVGIYLAAYAAWWLGLREVWSLSLETRLVLGHSIAGRGMVLVFGVLAAWWHLARSEARPGADRAPGARGLVDLGLLAILAALAGLLSVVSAHGYFPAELRFGWWHVPEGALWTAFVLVLLTGGGRLRRLFVNPVLGALGVISYSVYLWHLPIRNLLLPPDARLAPAELAWRIPVALAAVIVVSAVSYRVIERPFLLRKPRER